MQNFMITLLSCSVIMSALALFYMAITPLLSKRYSEKGRYYVWLVVIIGLIIPFRPQFDNAFVKVSVPKEAASPVVQFANGTPVPIPSVFHATDAAFNTTATSSMPWWANVSWWQIAALVWLAGMIVFIVYHVYKHIRFVKMVNHWSGRITDEQPLALLQSLIFEMDISKQIELYQCLSVGSPMMIGFVHTRILLPKMDFTEDELRFILKHELVHYQRKDLYYKFLVLIATAIHWFNPIVYLIARTIGAQCECSCDAETVRSADADTRRYYSETIIRVVKYQSKLKTALSTNFYGGKKGMKKRIFSIMDTNRKKAGVAIVFAALLITTMTGVTFAEAKTNQGNTTQPPTSAPPVNAGSDLSASNSYKDVTLTIDSVIKNDKVATINYSIQDEQNLLGEDVSFGYEINGEDYPLGSRAVRGEDGKLYGTINAFSLNGFGNDNIELQTDQMMYNQSAGQTSKLNINMTQLKTPSTQNVNNSIYLKPNGYNYRLPIKAGEGEAWISNIGVVNGKLHVQIKTVDPSAEDGVVANDVQPSVTDKNGKVLFSTPESGEGFSLGNDGQIDFSGKTVSHQYIIREYVFDMGQNKLADLSLGFSSIAHSYLNGTWAVSFAAKDVMGSVTRDLTGLKAGKLALKSLTVTPLYIGLGFDAAGINPYAPVDVPALVITYKDGHTTNYGIYHRAFTDNGIRQIFYIATIAGNEPTEINNIRSIRFGDVEIFNISRN